VKDALMAGLPLLVNAHGAMAELPEEVCARVAEAFTPATLAAAIAALLDDAPARAALAAAGRRWACAQLAPAAIAGMLAAAIEESYAAGPQAGLHRAAALAAGLPLDGAGLAAAGTALAASWPGARRPRLWLDTGLPDGLAEGLAALLREGADAFRPEPFRFEGAQPRTDHAWAWARLGLAGAPPEDGPAVLAPGDALLSAAEIARPLALATGCRRLPVPRAEGPALRGAVLALLLAAG
jgi:hypothetical protein